VEQQILKVLTEDVKEDLNTAQRDQSQGSQQDLQVKVLLKVRKNN
jgi:hypothetical protein